MPRSSSADRIAGPAANRKPSVGSTYNHEDSRSPSQPRHRSGSSSATRPSSIPHTPVREYERQSARSFIHGSIYNAHHNNLGSPDVRYSFPAYGSENVRAQTAELADKALTDANSPFNDDSGDLEDNANFQRMERAFSANEPTALQPTDTTNHESNTNNDFSKQTIEERSEPSSPDEAEGSATGSSYLTHLLKTSPPQIITAVSDDEDQGPSTTSQRHVPIIAASPPSMGERDSLLRRGGADSDGRNGYGAAEPRDLEAQGEQTSWTKRSLRSTSRWGSDRLMGIKKGILRPKTWNRQDIWQRGVVDPVTCFPAVVLGLLLNVLDGLSYGMILFPLGEPIFSALGPDGLSMFYVSCIISQLVYSCGGSVFKGGIGSEMIEVVPFFHKMAYTILAEVGKDNPKSVIATTILSFAVSSVITGLVFFGLGYARLGSLIGFFPRHILVGCIGGVGWFLVATGLEVSARLGAALEYNLPTLSRLFQADTIALWIIPLALATALMTMQHYIKHPLLVPLYFMAVPGIFYIIVTAVPSLHVPDLRESGWIFEAPPGGVPFWHFYTLYDFKETNWSALFSAVPAMFALTFFGILHVPINVPALGVSTGEDDVDVDRELIAHGISNAVSGMAGSIQNYLVYTNSILFIRSGGNSRLAGIMLAIGTIGIWMIGPVIIGYIPVMVVAALIFLLGFELLREALYDTWGKLHMFEYITVCVIVVTMGAWDFVVGILVGILLACVSFVVQTSQKSPIRATYSGSVARSTVRRHPFQQRFLKEVGPQIFVCKLAGYMFFGTINGVEKKVKDLVEEQNFSERPIRYLILDMTGVRGLDFSAAEAFTRMKRLLQRKNVNLVLSGVVWDSDVGRGLKGVGIFGEEGDNVHVFEELNASLEWCENEFLRAYYAQRDSGAPRLAHLDVPRSDAMPSFGVDASFNSPRRNQLHQAAKTTLKETETYTNKWSRLKQPLPLILQTFQERTKENEDFWFKAVSYFKRKEFKAGTTLYKRGDTATEFYLLQEGILKAEYDLEQGQYYESIVAGTTCGELPFFSETLRTANVVAERDSVTWAMDEESWEQLQEKHPDVGKELLRLALKLTTERVEAVTSYVLTRSA